MRYLLTLIAVVGAVALLSGLARSQELLTNPGLELTPPDVGGSYSTAPGWTTDEGPPVPRLLPPIPADYNDDGWVDAADYVVWRKHNGTNFQLTNELLSASPGQVTDIDYTVWRARFGDPGPLSMSEPSNFSHILETFPPNPPAPDPDGGWQHWFEPYNGTFAEQEDNFAHLYQDVPGTPGLQYTMTGWAMGEETFPGGVANLNAEGTGAPFEDGPLSPTNVYFALEFLDANEMVLPGSVEMELRDDLGFVNSGDPDLGGYLWQEFMLSAAAPPETVSVRVRASMTDGVLNPVPAPQSFRMSFFVDAFSLTAGPAGTGSGVVPEPGTCLLACVALGIISASRRRVGWRRYGEASQ